MTRLIGENEIIIKDSILDVKKFKLMHPHDIFSISSHASKSDFYVHNDPH